jgi:hypothetical protein
VRRLIIIGLLVTSAASVCFASAAAVGGISGGVAAGSAAIAACDANGFTVSYTTSGGNVTAIAVNGIADPACEGADLSATLTNAGGASIASGGPATIPTDGDTVDNAVAVPVSPNPAAEQVTGYHVAIVGP